MQAHALCFKYRAGCSAPMKCLLTGLASLLLASPSLAFEEVVEEGKGTTWNSGWGMMESGARLTWRVADVKTGRITLLFLTAGDDNIVTRDGLRYWSTGEVNCREGTFEYFYVYNAKKRKGPTTQKRSTSTRQNTRSRRKKQPSKSQPTSLMSRLLKSSITKLKLMVSKVKGLLG